MYGRVFLCDSAYQLLSALCIISNEGTTNNDCVLLVGLFKNWEKYVDTVTKFGCHTIVIKPSCKKPVTVIRFVKECLVLRSQIGRNTRLYVTSQNGYAVLFYYLLSRFNNEICFFDVWLYSYICKLDNNPFREYFDTHKIFRLFLQKQKINYKGVIYNFEPDLVESSSFYQKNKIIIDDEIIKLFSFDQPNTIIDNSKIILFDSYFLEENDEYNSYVKILKLIQNSIKGNGCIKRHPRNDFVKVKMNGFKECGEDNNIWEIESKNINFTSKTLITSYSSAVFTPAIMGVRNYNIVLLYKLILGKENTLHNGINSFIDRFKDEMQGVRVFIPETEQEIIEEMEKINEDIKG